MRITRFAPAVVALALVAGACGDSTGPQIELSAAEASALFGVLDNLLSDLDFGGSASRTDPGLGGLPRLALSVTGMPPLSGSSNCPQGGNVSVGGSVADDGSNFDASLGFNGCKSEGYTIDGDLGYNGSFSQGNSFSFEFHINGTLTVTLPDDRTGACKFDLDASFSEAGGSITGSVCGQNVNESGSF